MCTGDFRWAEQDCSARDRRDAAIDSEYCANRRSLEHALAQHHFRLKYVVNSLVSQSELPQLPVSVLGLAFRDFEHNRGTVEVGTPWELHPTIVTVQ